MVHELFEDTFALRGWSFFFFFALQIGIRGQILLSYGNLIKSRSHIGIEWNETKNNKFS